MGKIKKQRIYEGGNGVMERWDINFNGGLPENLQNVLVSAQPMMAGNKVAVVVNTSNCTGIAGSFNVAASAEDSGTPSFALGVSLALAPTGSAEIGAVTPVHFGLSHVVLDATGVTWPTEGSMTITIITKF